MASFNEKREDGGRGSGGGDWAAMGGDDQS